MKSHLDQLPTMKSTMSHGKLIDPWKLFSRSNGQVEVLCRERTAAVYMGDGKMLSRVLGRFKFLTDASDLGFAPHIIMDGYWEIWLTRWMVENVKTDWIALDVGANYGYYSLLLSELVGSKGRVLAFDPNPECARATKFSLGLNNFASRSEVHELALSNTSGTCEFFVPHNEPKNGRMELGNTQETSPDRSDSSNGRRFTVSAATLDEKTESLERLDFIKIDAEGGEQAIFEGMKTAVARHNPLVVMEYNSGRGDAAGFARQLKETYPNARYLDENGKVRPLDFERLSFERVGEDWLLILKQ